jgi:hypothetical protein
MQDENITVDTYIFYAFIPTINRENMIIVNFATGHYLRGQQRLHNSLLRKYNFLGLNDYKEIGSPTHGESPYQFKIHAIERAFEFDDIVLWADASIWVVGDLSIVENIIKQDGFFGEESGHYCYDWANEHCRNYHNLKQDEGLIMYSAGLTGINKNNPVAMDFFNQWKASALAGCFKGEHKNHRQ